ncbi:MAG: outer membrane protein transport protein, partial [Candidatus Zixiibacteriota bacterium]
GDDGDNINAIDNQPYDVVPEYYSNNGKGWGFGYKIGFLYEASEKLNLALVLNGPSSIDLSGTTDFIFYLGENLETTLPLGSEERYFLDGHIDELSADFDATLKLPASVGVGLAYELNDKLTLALDAEYTFWSAFEGFEFKFSNFDGFVDSTFTTLNNMYTTNMSAPVNWDDGGRVMFGANYKLNNFTELRGGFGVDQTIVSAETIIPQFIDLATKYSYSFGVGFDVDYWTLGLAVTYTHQADLTSANYSSDYDGDGLLDNIAGDYQADNYHTVLGISYRF